eukprot:TRINITY_DN498_c3_g1_i1.p3 TRINITY_DN498_c3_g1~~TRINITY_DN498_c3_g1_i1.p3  ORF type:complete len:219 (-),score=-20.34 TRINITY_DN498_c3_g1_i1:1863-2447(-)
MLYLIQYNFLENILIVTVGIIKYLDKLYTYKILYIFILFFIMNNKILNFFIQKCYTLSNIFFKEIFFFSLQEYQNILISINIILQILKQVQIVSIYTYAIVNTYSTHLFQFQYTKKFLIGTLELRYIYSTRNIKYLKCMYLYVAVRKQLNHKKQADVYVLLYEGIVGMFFFADSLMLLWFLVRVQQGCIFVGKI